MKASEFCYWLQGYFEISESSFNNNKKNDSRLGSDQVEMIKRHLAMVFVHDLDPKQVEEKLQQITMATFLKSEELIQTVTSFAVNNQ